MRARWREAPPSELRYEIFQKWPHQVSTSSSTPAGPARPVHRFLIGLSGRITVLNLVRPEANCFDQLQLTTGLDVHLTQPSFFVLYNLKVKLRKVVVIILDMMLSIFSI